MIASARGDEVSGNLDEDVKAKAIGVYDKSVAEHGDSNRAVLWDNAQSQYFRFYQLIRNLDVQDPEISILDVGCGNGELYRFLHFCGFRGTYTGIDINENLLSVAREKYCAENVSFLKIDLLSDDFEQCYDYVLMSGLFNSNYGQDFSWICRFTEAMYRRCRKLTVFNMISTHVNYRDEELYYVSPGELLSHVISSVTPFVTLVHNEPPYNFQIELKKTSSWRSGV